MIEIIKTNIDKRKTIVVPYDDLIKPFMKFIFRTICFILARADAPCEYVNCLNVALKKTKIFKRKPLRQVTKANNRSLNLLCMIR